MIAYFIDAANKAITQVDYSGLPDLQRMVEGSIELACYTRHGDTLFVNEESLFTKAHFFAIRGGHQPFAGNGVIVGEEIGETANTRPPKGSLAEVTSDVGWLDRSTVRLRSQYERRGR